MILAKIRVSGAVQGVFFRESAMSEARQLGLNGFARNEADSSVYLEAEGGEENVRKFVDWCRKGPPMAKVENIDTELSDSLVYYKNFEMA
ncbi:MAG: Acylphosphatase [Candidatus Jorgensenbacteria bacterium GW2011_GWA1_48_11]|uniref:acylphosphatase n=1 Tax=Candidatus Jorgensenbacteria bacterium GW2011_GWA1_48_11 TaxID=1618660 RepID=A0A0G1UAF2_9BACT|nr:MAG: Acylphosphatase [Candidatus Jorgensenbacteria bacterium GW2011_GWA1_48_11]KKW11775.1 MAG: Acylphosphatase [Candidatus Jorgensenbacteria bacterium GW2011_GWB1_49_9]